MTAEILSNPLSSLFRLESSEFCALGPLPGQKEEQREGESQTLCPGNGAYVALEGALLRSFYPPHKWSDCIIFTFAVHDRLSRWSPFGLANGPLFDCQSADRQAKVVPFSISKWAPFRLTNTN